MYSAPDAKAMPSTEVEKGELATGARLSPVVQPGEAGLSVVTKQALGEAEGVEEGEGEVLGEGEREGLAPAEGVALGVALGDTLGHVSTRTRKAALSEM